MSSKSGLKFLKVKSSTLLSDLYFFHLLFTLYICYFVLQALLFVINLLLVITGTALLCAGIWLCSNSTISQFTGDSSLKSIQSIIYTASYILIAYGGSTFLVAMCGCCNIFHTNQVSLQSLTASITRSCIKYTHNNTTLLGLMGTK